MILHFSKKKIWGGGEVYHLTNSPPLKTLQLHKIITHAPPPTFFLSLLFHFSIFFYGGGGGYTTWPTHPLSKKFTIPPPPPQTSIFIFFFCRLSLFLHFSKKYLFIFFYHLANSPLSKNYNCIK